MEYKVEELPLEYFGQQALLDCTIEITDYEERRAEPDVGYAGGIEVNDFDIIGNVLIVTEDGEEHEFGSDLKNQYKQLIWDKANWAHIEEKLGEQ